MKYSSQLKSKNLKKLVFYKGDTGMWSWVLHRISGVTIFFFLFIHVLDTALIRISDKTYNEIINTYKNPIIGVMEIGIVAAVAYHALNGIRVVLIDFWHKGPKYQKQLFWFFMIIFVFVMIIMSSLMINHIIQSISG